MPKRVNIKIGNCWACPWIEWIDNGFDEYEEVETAGYFCRRNQRLVVEQGNYDYITVYGEQYGNKGFPGYCDLPEDGFNLIFNDEEE
jgi:hypothetical protein